MQIYKAMIPKSINKEDLKTENIKEALKEPIIDEKSENKNEIKMNEDKDKTSQQSPKSNAKSNRSSRRVEDSKTYENQQISNRAVPKSESEKYMDNAQDIQELEMHQNQGHDETDKRDHHKSQSENSHANEEEGDKPDEDQYQGDDQDFSEPKMLEIAENAFSRISQEMLRRDLTSSMLFKHCIQRKQLIDEEIDIIKTSDFIEGLSRLEITDFTEQDLKCLIRVLEKPYLDNSIQLQDLKDILENFGVKEHSEQNIEEDQNDKEQSENNDQKKQKKKQINYEKLEKDSIFVLSLFTDYLLDSDISVYEYFDGVIYNQIIKTKNKQSTVEIVSANDFLKKVRSDTVFAGKVDSQLLHCKICSPLNSNQTDPLFLCDECRNIFDNVCEVLCLDSNYKQLLLIKKLIKCLEELSHNEGLREKAGIYKQEEPTEKHVPDEINGDVFVVHGDN